MAQWKFLPNDGEEEEGLGDAGIETFRGSPYSGIARECSQNSLDAAAKLSDGLAEEVHLIFRRIDVDVHEIPQFEQLASVLDACLLQARLRGAKKEIAFFERAIELASRSTIPVLSIEDYGTTGLLGPAMPGTPFSALVKSSGISQKPDDAGGSFGIGKNAVYAVSSLRTVFYSTKYQGNEGDAQLGQGKSILVSHVGNDGKPKRATGYWGNDPYKPVEKSEALPAWLRRSAVGTTVASVGFIEEPNWHWQVTESLVRNFFSAIETGVIRFTVIGSGLEPIEINKNSLRHLFEQSEVRAAAEMIGSADDLGFSAAMLEAITAEDAHEREKEFKAAGTFRIRLLQRPGFPKRVGILRNGMYIASNLNNFSQPLSRFNLSRDFVAVLEPVDRATRERIRSMESPKHDELSPERFDDVRERERMRTAMKKVGTWVRDVIKDFTTDAGEEEVLLQEMNRFFARPGEGTEVPDPSNQNDDPERTKIRPRITTEKPVGAGPGGGSGSSGGRKDGLRGGGVTTGDRNGVGRGAHGGRGGRSIPYVELRNVLPDSSDSTQRVISFTPAASGSAVVELIAIGVSSDEALSIQSLDDVPCSKSPCLDVVEGHRTRIKIVLSEGYSGPIGLTLTRTEGGPNAN